jgi:hypothetical protein
LEQVFHGGRKGLDYKKRGAWGKSGLQNIAGTDTKSRNQAVQTQVSGYRVSALCQTAPLLDNTDKYNYVATLQWEYLLCGTRIQGHDKKMRGTRTTLNVHKLMPEIARWTVLS